MKNKKRLFSKALFKQSCKANGAMWLIITFAVCFMLCCVMLISGTSGISTVKEGIEDTIIKESIKAEIKKSSIELYDSTDDAEYIFDKAFAEKIHELNTKNNYLAVKKVKDKATSKGEDLVKDIVADKIEADVTSKIEGEVTKEVEDMIKEKVTEKVTAVVTDKVTQMVKTEAAARLFNKDAVKSNFIASTLNVTQPELEGVISNIMSSNPRLSESEAFIQAIAYFAQYDLTNTTVGKLNPLFFGKIASAIQSGTTPEAAITNAIQNQIQESINAAATVDDQTLVAAQIQNDTALMAQYKNAAMASTNVDAITDEVIDDYKDKYIEKAKKKIATDKYIDEVTDEVIEFKQDKYVEDAKDKLSAQLDRIEEQATDEITEILKEIYIKPAYEYAVDQVSAKYPEDTEEEKYGSAMVTINPDNQVDDQYIDNNEPIPEEYINNLTDYIKDDILAWENNHSTNTLAEYIESDERKEFRHERAYNAISFLIGSQLTDEENKQDILDELADYDVDEEKYDSMGFDYDYIKQVSHESMEEYQNKLTFEANKLPANIKNDKALYETKIQELRDKLLTEVGGSLLDKLPEDVTDGIKELGTMDLYGLIVGSIFYKMAGLLLPIIYVIMVSNNLIASQVDTGSMAYVLSTSTRRKEVTFTQALYLIGSLAIMFVLTCITSIVCFNIAQVSTKLDIQKIIYLNLGAFATMFAISGINFFASCYFDRSKRAMALGGGISMFFLVTTILGLFGSPVIPSVVRIAPLNYFNYVSIISLFDVISILDGELGWIIKALILLVIGLVGYIIGSIIFKKKDLPL